MRSDCDRFIPDLVDAAEGRPTPELERHLHACAACRKALASLEATLEEIAPGPAPEPGPWLAARVRAEAAHRRHRRSVAFLAVMPVAAMALTALLVLDVAPGPWHRRHVPLTPNAASSATVQGAAADSADDFGPGTLLPDPDTLGSATLPPGALSNMEATVVDPDGVAPDDLDPTLGGSPWGLDVHQILSGASPDDLDALLNDFPG